MDHTPAKFNLQGVQVKECSFEQAEEYSSTFNVDIDPSGIVRPSERTFQLHLKVRVYDEDGRFEAKVHQVGNFVFNQDIQDKELSNYFIINAPAIMFPYVRSFISALTSLSGYSTITIPAMNLTKLADQLRASIRTEE